MGKEVVIHGIVMQEAVREENQSLYRIKAGEKEYAVISEGIQAVKDHIFIRKGQRMIVEGKEKEDKILSQKSKIVFRNWRENK